MTIVEELTEVSHWEETPLLLPEEHELDLLAFELWRQGCCPEVDEVRPREDEQAR